MAAHSPFKGRTGRASTRIIDQMFSGFPREPPSLPIKSRRRESVRLGQLNNALRVGTRGHTRDFSLDSSSSEDFTMSPTAAEAVFQIHKRTSTISSSDGDRMSTDMCADGPSRRASATESETNSTLNHESAMQVYRQISKSRRSIRLLAHESVHVPATEETNTSTLRHSSIADIRSQLRSSWYSNGGTSSEDESGSVSLQRWCNNTQSDEEYNFI